MWQPDYLTGDAFNDFLRVTDDADETEAAGAIAAASRAIDRRCRRQFGKVDTPEARWYPTRPWRGRAVAVIDDLMTTDGLVVGAGITDYELWPVNAPQDGKPWERILLPRGTDGAALTAGWGWLPGIPETIVTACKLQSSRFLARRDSPFGVAGSPELGNELRLLARLDPDVMVMVESYRRLVGAR